MSEQLECVSMLHQSRKRPQQAQTAMGDIPIGEHVVHFYETDDMLMVALQRYVKAGLAAGEACVVIATPSHRRKLQAYLRSSGLDLLTLRRLGMYATLDADKMLATFMVNETPDPARFMQSVTRVLRQAAKAGRPLRIYGEMVAQLWQEGNSAAAIRLEALWNELLRGVSPRFTLMCAYPARLFDGGDRWRALAAVCQQHAYVMPDDPTLEPTIPDEWLQAMSRLEQRAHSLQVEIARRQFVEERLRISEQRYRRLFEDALDGVLMLDPHTGRISEANPAAAEMIGQPAEQLLGQGLWQVGLFADREAANDALQTLQRQAVLRREALALRTATGDERWVEFVGSLIAQGDGNDIIQCTLRDVTEHERLAREVAERTYEMESLQAVTDVVLAQSSLDALLRELLERTTTILRVDNVAILLPDASGDTLTIHMARGPEEEVAGQVRVPIGQGIAGRIAATRQPLVVDDLRTATVANPFLRERLSSLMGVPLLVDDRLIGVIHTATIQPHHFTPREVHLLQLLAERIALAIERAQLHEMSQQARQEAAERARQLQSTIEAIADGVVVLDRSGSLIQMNGAAQRLLGYDTPPTYVVQQTPINDRQVRDSLGQPLPPEEWPVSRVLRGEIITGAQAVDLQVQTTDGQDVELSVSGAPMLDASDDIVGAVCVLRDVTAQRHLERRTHAALTALLAMASALVELRSDAETQPPAMETVDAPALLASPAAPVAYRLARLVRDVLDCQRVGIVAIEPETRLQVPLAVAGMAPEAERAWWTQYQERPRRYGDDQADPAVQARLAAGEAVIIDLTQLPYSARPNLYGITQTLVAPMRAGAQLVGVLALDFGDSRHTFTKQEQALAEAVAQLVALVIERDRLLSEREEARASALAAQETARRMNMFLGIAGHELRTPVTSIKAGVQIAERALHALLAVALPADALRSLQRAQAMLARADEQSNRLNRLIEDILDVIRTQSGRLELHAEPADLVAVVRQAVEGQRLTWPDREIKLAAPRRPVIVALDADRIEQVVANYLTNALKYSADDQPVAVTLTMTAQVARVAVQDHGPGLSPEMQAQAWEPFHQVDGIQQQSGAGIGLGLGLHICRTLIERHDGWVGVESATGEGSTFWFELPLALAVSDDPPAMTTPNERASASGDGQSPAGATDGTRTQ